MSLYEEVDYEKLELLETKHNWIVEPIYKASTYVKNMPFYDWIENLNDPKDFRDAGCQLYYHSEQDREKWLVGLNSGIERCSNDFFKAIAPKMHKLGVGDEYFDVHVEADEHHSIMGLDYITKYEADSTRGKILIAKALEGIELWASMIHSWIGISTYPKFNLKGEIIKDIKC
ncbi:MAG TPA: hypothetical protein EYG92_07400 [Lutibacter sp.]|nr:hypothetical protein [Lutibacter sp.]